MIEAIPIRYPLSMPAHSLSGAHAPRIQKGRSNGNPRSETPQSMFRSTLNLKGERYVGTHE